MKFHIFLDFSVKFIKDKSASENNLVENRKFCFVFVGVPRFSEKAAREGLNPHATSAVVTGLSRWLIPLRHGCGCRFKGVRNEVMCKRTGHGKFMKIRSFALFFGSLLLYAQLRHLVLTR